jgi:hypothetical protein
MNAMWSDIKMLLAASLFVVIIWAYLLLFC